MERRAILAVLASFPALLLGELLPIRSYNTADGLAADHVDCVVSDSRGFLWFCTPEGLSRFDGVRFVSYGPHEGLPHQFITGFLETRSGEHWIGTPKGLTRINARNAAVPFTTYQIMPRGAGNFVGSSLETRSGEIVTSTANGLFGWRTPANFRRIGSPVLDSALISAIAESADGALWIGTTEGIVIVRGNTVAERFGEKDGL